MKQIIKLADISSRGGKVPPIYIYLVFILPGFTFSILVSGEVKFVPFVVSAISIMPLMAAINLFDDFFDFRYGLDKPNSPNSLYRRHPIFSYHVRQSYLLKWAILFSLLYFALISLDSFLYSPVILAVGSLGFLAGYGYTGPPLRYKYYGFGEVGVFVSVLLANLLISISCLGRTVVTGILYTIPFSFLIVIVFLVGNARDIESDSAAGLVTVPVLLGKRRTNVLVAVIGALFYVITVVLVLFGIYGSYAIFVLVTSPLAYLSISKMHRSKYSTAEWYLGPYVFVTLLSLAVLSLF
ncbi:MAG: prenyltransferase [Thermoplasmatales archaeon]